MSESTQIVLNDTEEIQQILGSPPSWLLRWGITLVFVAVLVLLAITWLVKYPDIVPAQVTITTQNPPIRVFAKSSGKIDTLLVGNQQAVVGGQVLAILDNTTNWQDVLTLENYLEKSAKNSFDKAPPEGLSLGALQNAYSTLVQNVKDYKYYHSQNISYQKAESLERQIGHLKVLNESLGKQRKTFETEVDIARRNLERNRSLLKDGMISAQELEQTETAYLQHKRQLESLGAGIINNDIQIGQLEVQILELRQVRDENLHAKVRVLAEDTKRLQSEVEGWKQNNTITAPISGKVSLSKLWTSKQFINANEELMAIVPGASSGRVFAKATMPVSGSGKVRLGMKANILLDNYPSKEFGTIAAEVERISLVPDKGQEGDFYLLELSLTNELLTSYGREIPFRQEMQGTANIVTKDRRILERIFEQLMDVVKNR